jgi:twitching motility protein PilT
MQTEPQASAAPQAPARDVPRELPQLPFTDLYVNLDDPMVPARFRADATRSNLKGNRRVPASFGEDIDWIRDELNAMANPEGSITRKGIRLRYNRFTAAEGETWAALRGVPLDLPLLENLGMNPQFASVVKSWGTKRGLVVVGGRTGAGKTTTCVSAIRDYLERLGGFAYTVEDPPEFQLQGAVSEHGFCLQNEITDESEWASAVKRAMRTRPDYLFLGEIRTPEAAEQLLKATTTGALVLTTVHGGSVVDALSTIIQLAEARMGRMARSILSDRLIAAVYQEMTPTGPSNTVLAPRRDDSNDQSASIIADGDMATVSKYCVSYEPAKVARR